MKYVMFETAEGARLPVIFPDMLTHVFVAGAMQMVFDTLDNKKDLRPRQLLSLLEGGAAAVVSAGFINLGMDISVHGESESLGGIKHNPADAARVAVGEQLQFMPDGVATAMLATLEERVKSGIDSDNAIAIGEHAFRAGWEALHDALGVQSEGFATTVDKAWSEYTPPDDLCGNAL